MGKPKPPTAPWVLVNESGQTQYAAPPMYTAPNQPYYNYQGAAFGGAPSMGGGATWTGGSATGAQMGVDPGATTAANSGNPTLNQYGQPYGSPGAYNIAGRSHKRSGRNWKNAVANYNPTDEEINQIQDMIHEAEANKNGLQSWKAARLRRLLKLAQFKQNARNGQPDGGGGGQQQSGYNQAQWTNGPVNWSI